MLRRMNTYEFLCLLGFAFLAGTIGAIELGSIGALRAVLQMALGLYVFGTNGVKALRLYCQREARRGNYDR